VDAKNMMFRPRSRPRSPLRKHLVCHGSPLDVKSGRRGHRVAGSHPSLLGWAYRSHGGHRVLPQLWVPVILL